MRACNHKKHEVVCLLLKAGARTDIQDKVQQYYKKIIVNIYCSVAAMAVLVSCSMQLRHIQDKVQQYYKKIIVNIYCSVAAMAVLVSCSMQLRHVTSATFTYGVCGFVMVTTVQ